MRVIKKSDMGVSSYVLILKKYCTVYVIFCRIKRSCRIFRMIFWRWVVLRWISPCMAEMRDINIYFTRTQGFRFFAMHIRGKEEMICSIVNEPTVGEFRILSTTLLSPLKIFDHVQSRKSVSFLQVKTGNISSSLPIVIMTPKLCMTECTCYIWEDSKKLIL